MVQELVVEPALSCSRNLLLLLPLITSIMVFAWRMHAPTCLP
jgi:hypothetical protein